MTDRYIAFTVLLSQPTRSDDAEQTIAAIRQIKGVGDVVPEVATVEAYWGRETARRDLIRDILQMLRERKQCPPT